MAEYRGKQYGVDQFITSYCASPKSPARASIHFSKSHFAATLSTNISTSRPGESGLKLGISHKRTANAPPSYNAHLLPILHGTFPRVAGSLGPQSPAMPVKKGLSSGLSSAETRRRNLARGTSLFSETFGVHQLKSANTIVNVIS